MTGVALDLLAVALALSGVMLIVGQPAAAARLMGLAAGAAVVLPWLCCILGSMPSAGLGVILLLGAAAIVTVAHLRFRSRRAGARRPATSTKRRIARGG